MYVLEYSTVQHSTAQHSLKAHRSNLECEKKTVPRNTPRGAGPALDQGTVGPLFRLRIAPNKDMLKPQGPESRSVKPRPGRRCNA